MKTIKKASLLFASLALVLGAGLVGNSDTKEVKAEISSDYTKITDSSSLSTGDLVALYCDANSVGVTGWSGKKDATVSATESEWVNYEVTVATGGFYLYDSAASKYITSPGTANTFKYGAQFLCTIDSNGVLKCNSRFLVANGTYYRMYGDIGDYKPFYVYKKSVAVSDASEIIKLIEAIGEVSYSDESKAAIEKARNAYDAASNELKEKVTNYQTLVDAENKYKELKSADDKAKVAAAEKLVNDLPSADEIIDLSRKTEIEDAEAAYLALTKEQKNIYNPAILEKLNKLVAKIEALDPSNEVLFDFTKTGSDAASISKSPLVADDIQLSTAKGTSTNDLGSYSNPIRLYKNQILTLSSLAPVRNLTEIKITAATAAYAKVMSNSKYSSEVTVTVDNTLVTIVPKYNISTLSVTFSAQTRWENMVVVYEKDSTTLFETDWAALRAKGGENGICYFLTNGTRAELDALIARYNAFSAEDQTTIGSKADGGTTIANTIEYVSSLLAKLDDNSSTGASGVVITSNNSYDKTSLIALFAILGIVTISGYYIIEKKKFSK